MHATFGLLQGTLPNTYTREDGAIYYQRVVPKDLRDRYPVKIIKVNLRTKDIRIAERSVAKLNAQYEQEWAALRTAPEASPETLKAHAEALLRDPQASAGPCCQ